MFHQMSSFTPMNLVETHFVVLLIHILPLLSSTFVSFFSSFLPSLSVTPTPSYTTHRKYTLPHLPLWIKTVTKHPQKKKPTHLQYARKRGFVFLLSKDVCNAGCLATWFWTKLPRSDKLSCQFSLALLRRICSNTKCDMGN